VSTVHPEGTPETTEGLADEQRYHWYVYVGVGYPTHVPVLTVKTPFSNALPESDGATVFVGGRFVTDVSTAKDTTDPSEFVRVVATVTYWPASAATCVYVEDVAPSIGEQVPGIVEAGESTVAVQSYHCQVDAPVGDSVHEPTEAVNTLPVTRVPETVGAVTKTGADCETSRAVALTLAEDTLLVAVTTPNT
jgi:hypothetical protein